MNNFSGSLEGKIQLVAFIKDKQHKKKIIKIETFIGEPIYN